MSEGTSITSAVRRLFGAVLVTALGAGAIAGVAWFLHRGMVNQEPPVEAITRGTIETPRGTLPHAFVELSVYADSVSGNVHGGEDGLHPGYVSYGPGSHIILPANAYVTLTIKGYDGGEHLNHDVWRKVMGTADGTVLYNGVARKELGSDEVQHTFTVHALPSPKQDGLFLNIPVLKQSDEVMTKFDEDGVLPEPTITVASFYTGGPGEYVWNCEFPCGDGTYAKFGAAMAEWGYMSGRISVVNA